ncbi:MAG: hypothetical protein AB7V13_17755 [Pseudorhodoplanes sp.]|uniref:hypothetical protein n=1 Tax=Pseudorhodoplanes sp. TaxID=1934341 RepID=UPI003D0D6340
MFDIRTANLGDGGEGQAAEVDVIKQVQSYLADRDITAISASEPDGVDALRRALAESAESRILVLYDPARIAVARGLVLNCPPSASLAVWKQQAGTLLSAYRLHRQRVIFASISAIELDPQLFQTALMQRLAMLGAPTHAMLRLSVPAWKAWQAIVACQAVAFDRVALSLDGELEAASLPLPFSFPTDPDTALSEFRIAEAGLTKAQAQLGELQSEIDEQRKTFDAERSLLYRQLAEVQQELREQFLAAAAHHDSLVRIRQEQESASAPIETPPAQPRSHEEDATSRPHATISGWKSNPFQEIKRTLTGLSRAER